MAETLGCTVNELLTRISSEELTEWMAYKNIKIEEENDRIRKQNASNK
jgi:hypothetical protein